MKYLHLKTALTLFAICCLFSCGEDFLDIEPKGAPAVASFWETETDAHLAANSLYIMNDFQGTYGRGMHLYSLIPSDDFIVGKSKGQIENIKNFFNDGTGSYTRDIWAQHYIVIKRANDIINNVPLMEIDTDVRDFVLGQAYFMRGLAYFQLSIIYGDENMGVPVVDQNTETFLLPRSENVSVNYNFAAADFTEAANLLPYFEDLAAEDYGKAHKNAAIGYLARTHFHNAQYDNASWAKAIDACDLLISSGKNGLEANFADAFTIANNWGQEYLWSVPSNTNGGSIFPGASLENQGWGKYNGWGYFAPTLELYESYDPNDLRRRATLLAFGDEFTYFGETRPYWSDINWSGFQFAKYLEPFSYEDAVHLNGNGDHPTTDLNLPLLRYAHILLMKAESQIMLGQNGDDAINQVRTRAGMPALSGATMDDIKYERRAEFAGELFGRYEDLIRWGDAATIIPMPIHGRDHEDKTDPNSAFEIVEIWPARSQFDPTVHHVWPIPPQVINTSQGTLIQNKGW